MMMINMLAISIPLGYTVTNISPSGVAVDGSRRWLPPDFATAPCTTGRSVTCKECTLDTLNPSEVVCFSNSSDVEVEATLGELCSNCPSGCGPFRNMDTMYDVLSTEFQSWPEAVQTVINFIGTVSFGAILLLVFVTWLVIVHAKLSAHRKMVERLRLERDLERMDKIWILERWAITLDDSKGPAQRVQAARV